MSQAPSRSNPFKILLVENSKTARAVLNKLLNEQGYHVDMVSTGMEAIHALKQNEYQLLIMDVFMPELNGYEATQRIRALENAKASIPIIAFTSSTSERDKKTCLEAGMNDYVIKSENNQNLLDCIQKYRN